MIHQEEKEEHVHHRLDRRRHAGSGRRGTASLEVSTSFFMLSSHLRRRLKGLTKRCGRKAVPITDSFFASEGEDYDCFTSIYEGCKCRELT